MAFIVLPPTSAKRLRLRVSSVIITVELPVAARWTPPTPVVVTVVRSPESPSAGSAGPMYAAVVLVSVPASVTPAPPKKKLPLIEP